MPHCASVPVPAYSFPEKFSSFSFLSLLTKAEVIAALVKLRAECNKVKPPIVIIVGVSTCIACKGAFVSILLVRISAEGQQSKHAFAPQAHKIACPASWKMQQHYSFKQFVTAADCECEWGGGLQIGKMSLFNAWYTKSTAIEEFETAQNQTLDQAGNGLRDNWVTAVQLAFKSSFKDVGKGCWTNFVPAFCTCILSTVRQQSN